MNYLQLVNDVLIETSYDDQITTVAGQIDDAQRAVVWVRDAWLQIQRAEDWNFRWTEGSFNTVTNQQKYTLAQQNLSPGDKIDIYSLRIDSEKKELYPYDYPLFRWDTATGVPRRFDKLPDDSLALNSTPDGIYQISYAYYAAPVTLSADSDVPAMPEAYHKAIVWLAVMNYAREQGREWNDVYQAARREFNYMYSDMQNEYMPGYVGKIPLA